MQRAEDCQASATFGACILVSSGHAIDKCHANATALPQRNQGETQLPPRTRRSVGTNYMSANWRSQPAYELGLGDEDQANSSKHYCAGSVTCLFSSVLWKCLTPRNGLQHSPSLTGYHLEGCKGLN
eukprot:1326718-Amphidinium_carterae.1